jgi:tetratricopeptide (TPR) repeat protein
LYTDDNHAFFLEAIASTYYEKNDLDNAEIVYEQITNLSSGRTTWGHVYAQSFYWLGKIYQQQNKDKKAADAYRRFLNLWKDADPGFEIISDAKEQLKKIGPQS